VLNTRPKWTEVVKDLKEGSGSKAATWEMAIGTYHGNVSWERRTFSSRKSSVRREDCGATNSQIGTTFVKPLDL